LNDLKNQEYCAAILTERSKLKGESMSLELLRIISDPQQSYGYEDGPWKRPGPSLLVAADIYRESQSRGIVEFGPPWCDSIGLDCIRLNWSY